MSSVEDESVANCQITKGIMLVAEELERGSGGGGGGGRGVSLLA